MNVFSLDTADRRCPEVMLLVRQHLKKHLSSDAADNAFCEIITTEMTTKRDLPMYCQLMGFTLVSEEQSEGKIRFVVSRTAQQSNVLKNSNDAGSGVRIEVVNIYREKQERDKYLHGKFHQLVNDLKALMVSGFQLAIPTSFGKDSTLILTAALFAHTELMNDPNSQITSKTPFIVIHVDTSIEVIPMQMYSAFAIEALKLYCKEQEINLELHIETPPLHEQFVSLFVGARKLPSTPNLNSDCAVIWKVGASERVQRKLLEKYDADRLVSCIGSRMAEGAKRAASLVRHGNHDKNVHSLITKNELGLQTFAPIIDWSTEDVFETLQRVGINPLVRPTAGYEIPSFMKSNRLLLKIYGDSANDTCEINIGDSKKSGCGGSARNGCHQCFKAGRIDKSASAQNEHARWGAIQKNASLVRDYVFSVAHDVNHRTMHPRTFDPITNHVILQPNILRSKTLEKILWYYTQLTFDDYQRSVRFSELVASGKEMEDEGYADIFYDQSMDEETKNEYLEMYRAGAQKHLIRMVTLEHAVFLSAQWAMDGVRSLPYRPLAIYDAVNNQGKRLPWPKVGSVVIDEIHDAITFPLCEPGVDLLAQWIPPARPWDILGSDHNLGCTEEIVPASLKARITYSGTSDGVELLRISVNGRNADVGPNTRAEILANAKLRWADSAQNEPIIFNVFLTKRELVNFATKLSDAKKQAQKRINFTKRTVKIHKSTGRITRHRTSLQMYSPNSQSSLEQSWSTQLETWLPIHKLRAVPYMSHQVLELGQDEVNFQICPEALSDWLQFGGYQNALNIHNYHLKGLRRRKFKIANRASMRVYMGADSFWSIMQSGLLSVSANTWNNCQNTLKRTELFHEAGLFNFSDKYHENIAHPDCRSMKEHRSLKAKQLMLIRHQRNESRRRIKQQLSNVLNKSTLAVYDDLLARFNALADLSDSHCSNDWIDAAMLTAAKCTGFDTLDYVSIARICEDWVFEHNPVMQDITTFVKKFGSAHERQMLNEHALLKVRLNEVIFKRNELYSKMLTDRLNFWSAISNRLIEIRRFEVDGKVSVPIQKKAYEIINDYTPGSRFLDYSGRDFADKLTGNYRALTTLMRGGDDVLSYEWHRSLWKHFDVQRQKIVDSVSRFRSHKSEVDQLGIISGTSRTLAMAALLMN